MTATITKAKARETDNWCRARRGLPYAFGGAFSTNPKDSTDCSGLVLQTAAYLTGRSDWPGNRYGSTESFRLDHKIVYSLGFKRLGPNLAAARAKLATLGFQPIMLVGLQHGGGGIYSHTACTLFYADRPGGEIKQSVRGIDWESRGGNPGVHYYDGARAWDDPLFSDFWYLDAKLEGAPTGPARDRYATLAEATGLSLERAAEILPTMVQGLQLAGCTNPNRIAMFIAQTGHESANFQATEEFASGADYEGRTDLGNTKPGDGVRFKGRTWIQITGRHNYTQFSRWAYSKGLLRSPNYFVDHPEDLADLEWAGVGAAWYWTVARPQINALCDAGDFVGVTRAINGGTNGLTDRQQRLTRAQTLGDRLLALTTNTPPPAEEDTTMLESISLYATPGETTRYTLPQMVQSIDGMTHRALIESAARYGDLDAIARIARVAAGQGKYRDQAAIRHATTVLAEIEAQHPEYLQAYLATTGKA